MAKVSEGDRLESHLDGLSQGVSSAKSVDVGFLERAIYPDGTSMPMMAALDEFDVLSKGQPPRPFVRDMV